ncbi:hypothetical protein [uncultured Thalassospira sp.]|uniref:hypothetical protein n=1 Tax=uncultured Thalassospira sp. TaxID=404382 RepID=UPI0030DC42A7|tara:strand:+ start:41337 stop:42146 length:810 start_codon:yes stop_codon:yes gene_type:complete
MAQHDMQIANNTGIAVRGDINAALAALVTNNSGDTAPSPTYPFMWWADSNTGHLKQRNAANTAWIDHGDLSSALLRRNDISGDVELSTQIMNIAGVPVGGLQFVSLELTGSSQPQSANFIRLCADLTGAGEYNEGKLTGQNVVDAGAYDPAVGDASGVTATAIISVSGSPLNGRTVHLIETEKRFVRPGDPGEVLDDAIRNVYGDGAWKSDAGYPPTGAFKISAGSKAVLNNQAASTVPYWQLDASLIVPTAGENRPRSRGVAVYMRVF